MGFQTGNRVFRTLGPLGADGYAGVWFYTTNPAFYDGPITKPQNESPIGALEGHLSYDVRQRLWMSLDVNFSAGGITS